MSFMVAAAVWEYARARGVNKYVLLALANRADRTGRCWASVDTLVADTGLGTRTVQRALSQLGRSGELFVVEPGGGRRKTTTYGITAVTQAASQPPETVSERHPFTDLNGVRAARNGAREAEKGVTGARKGAALTPDPVKDPVISGPGHDPGKGARPRAGTGRVDHPRQGAADETRATRGAEPPLLPPTEDDRRLWNLARRAAAADFTPGNRQAVEQLELLGRGRDGGLVLRAPPSAISAQRFRQHLVVALSDAGDPAGPSVVILER